jgi:hypothetical protein
MSCTCPIGGGHTELLLRWKLSLQYEYGRAGCLSIDGWLTRQHAQTWVAARCWLAALSSVRAASSQVRRSEPLSTHRRRCSAKGAEQPETSCDKCYVKTLFIKAAGCPSMLSSSYEVVLGQANQPGATAKRTMRKLLQLAEQQL